MDDINVFLNPICLLALVHKAFVVLQEEIVLSKIPAWSRCKASPCNPIFNKHIHYSAGFIQLWFGAQQPTLRISRLPILNNASSTH